MREVKALANMHHGNIVRYYTSWTEEPPIGWQEEFDRRILSATANSSDHYYSSSLLTVGSSAKSSLTSAFSTQDQDVHQGAKGHNQLIDSISEEDSLRLASLASQDSYVVFAEDDDGAEGGHDVANGDAQAADALSEAEAGNLNVIKPRGGRRRKEGCRSSNSPKMLLYIQMELCAKETLREWLQKHSSSASRERTIVLAIFRQIVEAVDYVHSSGLMHRDLKPSNIFFSSDGVVKVGDFGLVTAAVETASSHSSIMTASSGDTATDADGPSSLFGPPSSSSSGSVNHTDNVGTFLYMSPDQLNGVSYSNKVDIYSLGVILYELLVPFRTEMERLHTLKQVRDLSFPHSFLNRLPAEAQLLRRLLSATPADRPSANEILQHALLAHGKTASSEHGSSGGQGRRPRTISIDGDAT